MVSSGGRPSGPSPKARVSSSSVVSLIGCRSRARASADALFVFLLLPPATGTPAATERTANQSPSVSAGRSCYATGYCVDWRDVHGSGTKVRRSTTSHSLGCENSREHHQRRRKQGECMFPHESLLRRKGSGASDTKVRTAEFPSGSIQSPDLKSLHRRTYKAEGTLAQRRVGIVNSVKLGALASAGAPLCRDDENQHDGNKQE
jgi:hypothetical protein